MSKNNTFISWSGNRSLHVAKALRDWLPKIIQTVKPWLSDHEIEKGTRGLVEVGKALEGMKVGIICLTPENLDEPWILFECGALSKAFSDDKTRVCTYLLGGLKYQNVKGPLSMFQSTESEKEDTRKLIRAINRAVSVDPLSEHSLDDIFDTMWPKLEDNLKAIPAAEKVVDIKRDPNELMGEILGLCRQYLPRIDALRQRDLVPSLPQLQVSPMDPPPQVLDWRPWAQTIWVKRKGSDELEYVDGKTFVETPAPDVLIIYRGPNVLARFDDVEEWGHWGDDNGADVKSKYKVDPKLG